ncbi:MAG: Fic family protein [Erysipelotrichaceae bacterium]|nr:Fic family protein [Erysipelotrichaceae bacterium]
MLKQKELKEIFERCNGNIELLAQVIKQKYDKPGNDSLSNIFTIARNMGVRLILSDFENDLTQLITNNPEKKAYITLKYDENIERLRHNTATMLYILLSKKTSANEVIYKSDQEPIMEKAKHFSSCLMMPSRELQMVVYEKNENNDFKYLDEYGFLPWENILYIAARFGVDFSSCAKRIFKVTNNIKGIETKEELHKRLENKRYYISKRKELIKDYPQIQIELKRDLIDNMHYVKPDRINSSIKNSMIKESAKQFSRQEGLKDLRFLNMFIKLIETKGNPKYEEKKKLLIEEKLTEQQRIAIGNYELLQMLSLNLNEGFNHENFDKIPLIYMENIGRKFPLKKLEEFKENIIQFQQGEKGYATMLKDLTKDGELEIYGVDKILEQFINITPELLCKMNEKLYKYALNINFTPGYFRTKNVDVLYDEKDRQNKMKVSEVIETYRDSIDWCNKAKQLVKEAELLSPAEYIDKVSVLAMKFWKIQPFRDGNKRLTKTLLNYLLSFKDLPSVFVDNNNLTEKQIAALLELSKYDNPPKNALNNYNDVIYDCICNSFPFFYDDAELMKEPIKELKRHRPN